ncbi:MAG: flagellar motor protein MotB [Treponema sp.]|jgi:chemotaxis protein MotB|nr:flagellar motor protein MotB [Treponema sp.]
MGKRERKKAVAPPSTALATYSDMVTLMLCFFLIMFNPDDVTQGQLDAISTSMQTGGLGALAGGLTLSSGRSAELGGTIMSLPSMEKGRSLGSAMRRAVSVFSPEVRSNKIRITQDERGLVITLASDAFFDPASARINIEATRDILLRLGSYLASSDLAGRKFRIEGHTDSVDVDPTGPWPSNWDLSAARSIAILRYLADMGIEERRFQISGFADTVPLSTNATPEGRAYNRRVDIIIIDDGHL